MQNNTNSTLSRTYPIAVGLLTCLMQPNSLEREQGYSAKLHDGVHDAIEDILGDAAAGSLFS